MDFNNWVERNRDKFGSEYEILFATQVLPLVKGLRCEAVTLQHPFVDNDGKNRYCDFTIIESDTVRVAIEIDGYDKRGAGTGMSYADFLDWQRRQASLASQGWHVLRFANRDVREEPLRCAEHISRLLNRLRGAQTGRVEIVTIQYKPPTGIVVPPEVKDARAPQDRKKRSYVLFPLVALGTFFIFWFWDKNGDTLEDRAVHATLIGPAAPGDQVPPRYVPTDVHPPDAYRAGALDPVEPLMQVNPVAYGTLDCMNPLDWSSAGKYIGRVITVIGPLLATKARPDVAGSPMWLDVGGRYPSQDRLAVVVWGRNWSKFDVTELDAEYWFETVFDEMGNASLCIKGEVAEYNGIPQIELQDPSQLKIAFHPKWSR